MAEELNMNEAYDTVTYLMKQTKENVDADEVFFSKLSFQNELCGSYCEDHVRLLNACFKTTCDCLATINYCITHGGGSEWTDAFKEICDLQKRIQDDIDAYNALQDQSHEYFDSSSSGRAI